MNERFDHTGPYVTTLREAHVDTKTPSLPPSCSFLNRLQSRSQCLR